MGISDRSGTVTDTVDGQNIYEEQITPNQDTDNCVQQNDGWFLYNYGKKSISFTLKNDVKELKVSFGGLDANWLDWDEIHVTLPEKYAVDRAWFSGMEAGGKNAVTRVDKTSTVIIRPAGDLPDNMLPRIFYCFGTNAMSFHKGC